MDAIILAGSAEKAALVPEASVAEAMIPIGDRPMVDYVLCALRACPRVERVAVVGPREELWRHYGGRADVLVVQGGYTVMQSMLNGLAALQPEGMVLVATGDIPLLNGEVVESFLRLCDRQAADLYYPVVPREVNEAAYPGVRRTYVRLREGTFTGGNLFLVNAAVVERCLERGEQLIRLRKSPLALARAIGFTYILRFLLHRLTMEQAAQRVSRLLGVRGVVVVCPHPEVGIDVDKPSDLELARRVLAV